MKTLIIAATCLTILGACSDRSSKYVGNFADPICAADGSVVYMQYATAKGDFPQVRASKENCAWNKKK
jgi:hypothetical protein